MIQLLGRGPVAEVYAVEGRALKVFPGRFDRRTLAAIERDRARLAEVSAPVLPFDGIEVVDGRHALRMELCADSLASWVRRSGPLSSEQVDALCVSLSRALAAAHTLGVLHGGISPTNVLFRSDGAAVLADFGVAQRQEFRRDSLAGIEWVSPETLRTGVVAEPTDVYGLGAVLHFALTGRSPHPSRVGELTAERILRVISDPVPAVSRPDVPIGLSTAIGRMLASNPVRRPTPSTAATPEPPAPSRPRRRRRLVTTAVSVVAVVAAVAVAVAVFRPAGTTSEPAEPPAPSANTEQAAPATEPKPVVVLHEPSDLEDRVVLNWTGDERFFATVKIWTEDKSTSRRELARYKDTWTIPVEPGRPYCFQVLGTLGGEEVYYSNREGVRDADCYP